MPLKIVQYRCEICKVEYEVEGHAEECESVGPPDASLVPIGMIHSLHHENMVFAICGHDEPGAIFDRHCLTTSAWACRDTAYGDNVGGKDYCEGPYVKGKKLLRADAPNQKIPAFKRMVEALKRLKIPITIWDGKRAVPYTEKTKA